MWGRRLWWEMPVEESQAVMEARRYCWVTCRGGAITIASLPPHQRQQLNNREPGPSNAWALKYRAGPHPGAPVSARPADLQRGPQPGAPLSAWCTDLQRGPEPGAPLSVWHADLQRGPHPGAPLSAWHADLQRGPQPGEAPLCLMCQTKEKGPRQGSPLGAWMGGVMEKDWPKRPSDLQLQEARKRTLIGS